jgi:predicted transposase/invertase (TIGR01784 family)
MSTKDKNSKQQGEKAMEVEISERYINPYTDFGFKKLFGSELNKDLLISFLNALFHDKPEITDLTYLNTEHLGEGITDRKAVFDVYCRLADGSRIIVEMQKTEQAYFKDRSIYYSTFPIREQGIKGPWDYHLEDVYTVGILNFTFPDNEYPSDNLIHEIKLKDVEDNHVFYDKLTFVYLEMPKFNKKEEELETMFDKWMFALANLARLLERPKALQERIFARLFEQAEVARFTPEEREEYVASKKEYWDFYSSMKTSYDKGLAEGHAEGLVEGEAKGRAEALAESEAKRAEERLSNAKALLANGVPLEVIVKSLHLTDEEAARLRDIFPAQ